MDGYDKSMNIVIPPCDDYSYAGRIGALRASKQKQTEWKMAHVSNMDEDDYGYVPPPEGFKFEPEFNDPVNQTFYGTQLWSRNFCNLLDKHPIYIDCNDAMCGRWMFILQRFRPFESAISNRNMEMAPVFDYERLKPEHELYDLLPGIGKMHHFAPDYRIGLSLGWRGLKEKVEKYQKINTSPESRELYAAELNILGAIRAWISHAIELIAELKENTPEGAVKDNLQKMYDCNARVLDEPPRTFREACQWMCWFNMLNRTYDRAGAGCQLDEVLLPYYKRDLEAGMIDNEEATFLLACLLMNDPVYYQIGGPDSKTGKDVTNELSFLILEAAHRLKTTVNLTIRWFDGLDPKLYYRGLEILIQDKQACPRFSGDKALVEGFMRNGFSAELARERIAVGCNWMSLPGREYTMNDLVKVNMAKVFEVAFLELADCEQCSCEALYARFEEHLKKAINCLKEGIDFHLSNQYRNAPELILNLCCHGPIEKGLDVSHGGVEFYNIAIDGAGIAVVADSFGAIEQRIEAEKVLTWKQCADAVRDNFASGENRYIRSVLSSAGRYGHGGTLADKWARRIAALFTQIVSGSRTPHGVLTIPGLFSWANTVAFGKTVGATPNGRYAGEPINQGANPNPGFRKDGAFSAMSLAIASLQPGFGNTAPWQLEIDPMMADSASALKNIAAVIDTHFDMGGTLININIVDGEKIRAAYKDSSLYPDLVVRVTGFTAYFATLSPEFQKMIVDRIVTND